MDHLEQRIQALEQEVQLLKGQIRATLLDIHEQLLTNTYPSLRMDGEAQPAGSVVRQDAQPPIKQVKPAQVPHASDDYDFPFEVEANEAFALNAPKSESNRPFFNVTDWSVLESIAQWVTTKVDEIGPERTRAILETYAQNQYWDPQIADALMQFATAPNAIRLAKKTTVEPSPKEREQSMDRIRKAVANIGRR